MGQSKRLYALLCALLLCLLAQDGWSRTKKKRSSRKKTSKSAPLDAVSAEVKKSETPITPPLPSGKEEEIVFVGVGDMMMGSTFPDGSDLLAPDDGAGMLSEVAPILSAADIAFGNLEGPLLEGGKSTKCSARALKASKCFAFRTPTHYGKYLKDAGFDLLSLANNHAMDFGQEGRDSTRKVLDDLGLAYAGENGYIGEFSAKGKKIILLGFAASKSYMSPTFYEVEEAKKMVSKATKKADVVIVSFHGGREGRRHQRFKQKDGVDSALYKFAHAVVDAGADLVVGHGPHVVRGMEVYKERLIAYSLGNFATYRKFNLKGPSGLSLLLEVRLGLDGAFLGGQIHPARQDWPGGPLLDPSGESIFKVKSLSEADFGDVAVQISEEGKLSPPAPSAP